MSHLISTLFPVYRGVYRNTSIIRELGAINRSVFIWYKSDAHLNVKLELYTLHVHNWMLGGGTYTQKKRNNFVKRCSYFPHIWMKLWKYMFILWYFDFIEGLFCFQICWLCIIGSLSTWRGSHKVAKSIVE